MSLHVALNNTYIYFFLLPIVQEINNVRLKIVRSEREVQKYDESLSKLQSEQNHEFQAIVDRRNKCIVSLVLVWKERQVIEARENQNNLKLKQLVAENKELKTKIENLEREEMNLWRTEAKGNEILPILTDIPELRYESATASTTNQQSSPATKSHAPSSTSSQEKTFEVVEKSPKKRKLDTRKSTPANKENIATTIQRTSTTACKKLPTTPPMVIKTRSMCSGKTPPQTKPAKTPEAAKETQKEENSADMVVEKSPPIPDVIDSTPNSPVKTAKDQDQTIMDLDEEFEAFDSVASSAGEPGSPGEVDDVNGSFFGGGPSADGDNWFWRELLQSTLFLSTTWIVLLGSMSKINWIFNILYPVSNFSYMG